MKDGRPAILSLSRLVLRVFLVLNLVAAIVFLVLLAMSFALEPRLVAFMAENWSPDGARPILYALRTALVIGLVAAPLAHVMFSRLLAIIATVRVGDPFVTINAHRLTVIAWCVLALQFLDLMFGAVAIAVERYDGPLSGWSLNLAGWIAVLLLFVLARVFEQGARMREDMEGTV